MSPERFLEQFGHLADAPNGITKLRELILQLAVRGKLVPQDPEDEPASVLLERIKMAKERLAAERNIRKDKPLPPMGTRSVPFEVPNGWEWAQIGDVGLVKGGKRVPKGYELLQSPTPHIYIRVTDMKGGTIQDEDLRYVSAEIFEQIRRYTVDKEDIYVTIAGTIGAVGIVPASFDGASLTENAAKIVFRQLDRRFLLIGVQSKFVQQYWKEQVNQMAQPKLALRRIATTPLPIPPITEQSRIVAKVDQLMALCDELEAKQNQRAQTHIHLIRAAHHPLTQPRDHVEFRTAWQRIRDNFDGLHTTVDSVKALRQTILQLAVQGKLVPQDPNDEPASVLLERSRVDKERLIAEGRIKKRKKLPQIAESEYPFVALQGWSWARWGAVADWITYGFTRPMPHVDSGPQIITAKNVVNNVIDLSNTDFTTQEAYNSLSDKDRPLPGDILITQDGTIGRAAIVATEGPFCINQSVAVLWLRSCNLDRDYLLMVINSPWVQAPIWEKAKGAAIKHISITDFGKMLLPVPPLAEQLRIVAKVDQLMTLCDDLEAKIEANQTKAQRFAEAVEAELAA